jgi:hypothetical protein
MLKYHDGAVIEPATSSPAHIHVEPFVGIILSGLATTTIESCSTLAQSGKLANFGCTSDERIVILTHGSVFGLSRVLASEGMPGRGDIIASSKSQATHVFGIPQQVFQAVCSACATHPCTTKKKACP